MLKWEISLRYWFHILWIYIHKWDYWIKGYLYFSYFEENPVFSQNGCTDLHFQMFVDEWIEKMWLYIWLHTHIHTHTHTYTHSGLLISLKKKRRRSCHLWQQDEPDKYDKWNKPDTEKQILHILNHRWNLKCQFHKNREQYCGYN